MKEEGERKRKDLEVQERSKWYKMWDVIATVSMAMDYMFCLECRQLALTDFVFKCHLENAFKEIDKMVK